MWPCLRASLALAAALLGGLAAAAPRVDELSIELASGRELVAQIRIPENAPGPLPAVMLFGGFRGASTVLDAVPADLALVAASFDYPFDPPRDFEFPQGFAQLPALSRGIDETFEGIRRLTAQLRTRPDVDPQRITIVGASLGAPFAVVAAAELGLPGLVVVHGFGDLPGVIAQQFIHALEPRYGSWVRGPSRAFAELLVWAYKLPSPEHHALRLQAQQRVLMIAAADDERVPPSASEVLWSGLQASAAAVERIDEPGAHLRGDDDPRIARFVRQATDWMSRSGLR